MTRQNKMEMVIAGAAGAFLIWLWLHNRAAGGGTGLEGLIPLFRAGKPVQGALSQFAIPAPVPGATFDYTGAATPNPAGLQLGLFPGSGGCNCGQQSQADSTFGSNTDLTAWLSSNPSLMPDVSGGYY